ncbi:MAG: hypothetical protein HY347_03685 [candidate division NC10 bacterium]|nr:hypothetical protein [candidate division NC10 bacterium]
MDFRQNIAVLSSEPSHLAHIEEARRQGALYRFRGAGSVLHWLQGEHAYLAVNGLASLLRRLAVQFDLLQEEEVSVETCEDYDLIFIPNAKHLEERTVKILQEVSEGKTKLVISGVTNLPDQLLGVQGKIPYVPRGFIGLKGLPAFWTEPCLVSPPNYTLYRAKAAPGSKGLATLQELQNPDDPKAMSTHELDGDGIILSDRALFLPFPIFEFIGGLLQGHLDLEPVRGLLGDAGNFYLDRMAFLLMELVSRYGWEGFGQVRIRPWGDHDHVLVLRHDTDSSRETAYLDFEKAQRVPATYAILLDENGDFWLKETAEDPLIERAFHFPSNRISRFFGLLPSRSFRPDKRAITGWGLTDQVKRARERFRVPFLTAHRHGGFLYYPETIEAMDHLYEHVPDLLGLGTMFRFTCLRYSASRGSHRSRITVRHPDVGVPLWFPFKLQVSTLERSRTLRGWDSSAFMEPDPPMTDLIFANAGLLPHGAYTMIFHPAHAKGEAFRAGGNYEWFLYAVEKVMREGWWVAPAAAVYQRLNEWEELRLLVKGDQVLIHNSSSDSKEGLILDIRGTRYPLEVLHPGETKVIERASAHVR